MNEEIKSLFQKRLGYLMGLLEISNNETLKREVKKHIWDLSDDIIELVNKEKVNNNDNTEINYNK